MVDLKDLCRLCGHDEAQVTSNFSKPVPKEKHQRDINLIFDIDVTKDDPEVHPPLVCQKCVKKIVRWRKNKNKCKANVTCNIQCVSWPRTNLHVEFLDLQKVGALALEAGLGIQKPQDNIVIFRQWSNTCINMRICGDASYTVEVNGKDITSHVPVTGKQPSAYVKAMCELDFCTGIQGFYDLCRSRSDHNLCTFLNKDGNVVAREEEGVNGRIVRHTDCHYVSKKGNSRCASCQLYRPLLSMMNHREKNKKSNQTTSHTKNTYLSKPSLVQKLADLKKENIQLKRKNKTIQEKLKVQLESEEIVVNNKSFEAIIENSDCFPPGSPQALLWEEQKKYHSLNKKTSMRWHPSLIKLAIAIHAKSSSAYETLRSSGYLALPHETTLRAYTNFKIDTGFSTHIIKDASKELKDEKDIKRYVSVVFDEMKIRDGLVYCSQTGRLLGFVDVGDIGNEIRNIADYMNTDHADGDNDMNHEPPLATHVIAFMVRGIFSNLKEVFAHYYATGFTSNQLYWVVWRAVGMLELAGFKVCAFIADGASPNRKFFRLHRAPGQQHQSVVFKTINKFCRERDIYFICDVPHLIKTTRNCWENSGWNKKSRFMEVIIVIHTAKTY